jgi:predicted lipoprotein with Yx(FWY)xxD motif
MTIYAFDKDVRMAGRSECNGQCATNWPPLFASADDHSGGDWSVITRDDGTRQWAWLGRPLYYYAKDQKPGDISGDGFS